MKASSKRYRASSASKAAANVPPWVHDPKGWMTTAEFAVRYRRTPRQIRNWCANGTIISFGMRTFQDAQGKWWIQAATP
jgi:hypothetical protein